MRRKYIWLVAAVLLVVATAFGLQRLGSRSRTHQLTPEEVAARLKDLDPASARAKLLQAAAEHSGQDDTPVGESARITRETIAFTPSAVYEVRDETTAEDTGKKSLILIAGVGGTRRLVVSEEKFTGNFDEFSSVKARRIQPEIYTEAVREIAGREVLEFTNIGTEGFEKVIFYLNRAKGSPGYRTGTLTIFALTATSAFGREEAAADYEKLLPTIEWQ